MLALITGSSGQDGQYLTEWLVGKGYVVEHADIDNGIDISVKPPEGGFDEIYNLAAITNSETSFEACRETFLVNTLGAVNMLELARRTGARIFQASSAMQNGMTPYGISKLAAHKLTQMYREVHGVYAVSGILHNHVSSKSKHTVINKICDNAKRGEKVRLGNLDAMRDWTHAKDVVRAMWMTLQQDKPRDYEIGRGIAYSVRTLCGVAGVEYEQDEACFKRADQNMLCANPAWLNSIGWRPEYSIEDIVRDLML